MLKKIFNNLITSILVGSFALTPYFISISEVQAADITVKSGFSISSLPQCSDVSLTTRLLFSGTVGALGAAIDGNGASYSLGAGLGSAVSSEAIDYLKDKLTTVIKNSTGEKKSVNVNIENTTSAENIKATKKLAEDTQKDISDLKDNSTCTAAIGRIVTKMLLQKLTVSTVNWIKSGFDGSPAFIQNPGKFFGDIAKSEVLQFGTEITASGSPFGKEWLKNTASAFNSKFQDNATYSLDKLIKDTNPSNPEYSAATFQVDFSQGGWDAWTAMTQSPANNPLGFKLMADNELQKRLAGTVQSTADKVHEALQQANGFLGDNRCADPEGVTKEEDKKGIIERSNHPPGSTDPATFPNPDGGADITVDMPYNYVNRICKQWKYVTPGSMIADAATSTMTDTKDSLLVAQDLNDAIAAVTNALLAQFSSDVMEKGFADITPDDYTGSVSFDTSSVTSQTRKDFGTRFSSSWLSNNPDFNIRTDLTQALIDEQRTFSDKLKIQNKELSSTTDGNTYKVDAVDYTFPNNGTKTKVSNAYGIIPTIYQLDFCIPGPNPNWQSIASNELSKKTSLISAVTTESMKSNSFVLGFLESIPIIGSLISSSEASDARRHVREYYGRSLHSLIGYYPDTGNENDDRASNLTNKGGITSIVNTVLGRYSNIINKIYYSDPEVLPAVAKEAAGNFNQIVGYNKMMEDNQDTIISLKTIVDTLGDIKSKVDALNSEYKNSNGEFKSGKNETDYEDKLTAQINAFGRLSSDMFNGNDIANTDNLTKQIIDKKDYIYKNLLKGPYGCEAALMKTQKKFPSAGAGVAGTDWSNFDANSVKRKDYPQTILYNYNNLSDNADIPDPLKSGYINKMPTYIYKNPGFLSFISFSAENGGGSGGANRRGAERLPIHDLVPQHDDAGMRDISVSGLFESTIGIY